MKMTTSRLVLAASVFVWIAGAPVLAQSPEALKEVEKSLSQTKKQEAALAKTAQATAAEINILRRQSVAIAARAAEHEKTLSRLESRRRVLSEQMAIAQKRLGAQRKQMTALLTALQRIAVNPPVALIALPQPPVDSVRSALLLRDTVPALEATGRMLRDDLRALSEISESLSQARARIKDQGEKLRTERDALMEVLSKKAALADKTMAAHEQTRTKSQELAAKARSLRELLARLSDERAKERKRLEQSLVLTTPQPETTAIPLPAPLIRPVRPPSRGLPAQGRVIAPFGRPSATGHPAEGVSLETAAGAVVIAPRSGTVVFAGPFRGLGELLIIEYGREYHLLLAGMARIEARAGEKLLAGEPVGVMDVARNKRPTLYMELRRKGKPINPLPWLRRTAQRK